MRFVLCPHCDEPQPTYENAEGRLKRFSDRTSSVLPGPLSGEGDGVVKARPAAVPGVHGEGRQGSASARAVRTQNSLPTGAGEARPRHIALATSAPVAPGAPSLATSAA